MTKPRYFNIQELWGVPLNLQFTLEQIDRVADNLAINIPNHTVEIRRINTDDGIAYSWIKTPTHLLEDILNSTHHYLHTAGHISLETFVWGIYYYTQLHAIQVRLNTHSLDHLSTAEAIIEMIVSDNAGAKLIGYYKEFHLKEKKGL